VATVAKQSGGIGRAVARTFLRTAVWLYRRSGGRIGGKMLGVPLLLLTTTGRRSGRPWTVPLMYQTDGDGWVLVASNGGSDRHPSWWLNLRATPDASIQIGRAVHRVSAAEATGAERERLFRLMAGVYSGYERYTKKTDRTIPVVRLHPR
jgi:F420H(2)-dependent quinone reductase